MIVEAVPYSGYRFAFWSDNNTDPLRNIEVTDDVHLTAYFTPLTAIDEATGIGYIRVSCDNPEHIIISDITGRILYSGNSANVTLSVPHGVYMVRVGDKQNKKIIVY